MHVVYRCYTYRKGCNGGNDGNATNLHLQHSHEDGILALLGKIVWHAIFFFEVSVHIFSPVQSNLNLELTYPTHDISYRLKNDRVF